MTERMLKQTNIPESINIRIYGNMQYGYGRIYTEVHIESLLWRLWILVIVKDDTQEILTFCFEQALYDMEHWLHNR